jgi:hypothetical protein
MTERKRKSKVGAPRTEVFAMRLDPKLKYLAEIAARKQRRSLANFVEWAIEQALNSVHLVEPSDYNHHGETVADSISKLWALDEPDRLIKLAVNYPGLLSYDEQLIWRVICNHSVFNRDTKRISRFTEKNDVNVELVRDCWPEIKAYGLGAGTKDELDTVLCQHDDIPF